MGVRAVKKKLTVTDKSTIRMALGSWIHLLEITDQEFKRLLGGECDPTSNLLDEAKQALEKFNSVTETDDKNASL